MTLPYEHLFWIACLTAGSLAEADHFLMAWIGPRYLAMNDTLRSKQLRADSRYTASMFFLSSQTTIVRHKPLLAHPSSTDSGPTSTLSLHIYNSCRPATAPIASLNLPKILLLLIKSSIFSGAIPPFFNRPASLLASFSTYPLFALILAKTLT